MTPLLLVLALISASPRPTEAALWEAAFVLDDPAEAPRAEALLTKAGPAGLDVLLKLARAGGESAALNAAAIDLRCPLGLAGDPARYKVLLSINPEPARIAARLLSTRMKEDLRLRERLLTSRSSFERRLVLAHLAPDIKALLGVLPRFENEKDFQVLTLIERALQCAALTPGAGGGADPEDLWSAQMKVNEKLVGLMTPPSCDSAESITVELREALRQRLWRVSAVGVSGGTSGMGLALFVDTGRSVPTRLTPACALALYDVLAQRDVYLHELVMPLATADSADGVTPEQRRAAAERAGRDLERYPKFDRNRLAAELVNAGSPGSRAIVLREDGSTGEVEWEAAARRRQPGVIEALETHVFCRDLSGASTVALLGFVGTSRAADMALQYAARCPDSRVPATAALLRLKDPRALELLGPALEQGSFERLLRRTALEAYTPALGEKLRALKDAGPPESKTSREAASLLESLKAAGLPVP